MMDVRTTAAQQIGHLTLLVYEVSAELEAAKAEIEALKKTQSEGKAQAEAMLAAETKEGNN